MTSRLAVALIVGNLVLSGILVTLSARAAADPPPEVLRGRAIELVDERGQVRAQIDVEPGGQTVLRLRDAKGEVRVKLGAGADGSGLLLLDGATEPGIHLVAKEGGSTVSVAGADGQRRLVAP